MANEIRTLTLTTEEISRAIGQKPIARSTKSLWINEIVVDTRSAYEGINCIFFALQGSMGSGNDFAQRAHDQGIRCFVLDKNKNFTLLEDSTVFIVENTITALQKIAKYKRNLCTHTKVVGITGSAGKTIIKEWLAQILSTKYATIQSPKSYNSQIGVPLSVWNLQPYHQVGIFEAGISTVGEMEKLRLVIQPEIGILTNIGDAHDAGFANRDEKLFEKLQLFVACKALIINGDGDFVSKTMEILHGVRLISWSRLNKNAYFYIQNIEILDTSSKIKYVVANNHYEVVVPFIDDASIENVIHVLTYLHFTDEKFEFIKANITLLRNLPLRLEVSNASDNISLVNDAYINDLSSLKIALDFSLRHQLGRKLILVLSEIVESGLGKSELEQALLRLIENYKVDEFYYVGEEIQSDLWSGKANVHLFSNYEDLQDKIVNQTFKDSVILIKGARKYGMERLFYRLKQKSHTAKLTINLAAIEHNIAQYKRLLPQDTRIMAVIKGSAYGSGAEAIGQLLQHKAVNYLSVANTDEATQLRRAGVTMPIIILNPDGLFVNDLLEYQLEPEVFSLKQLHAIVRELYVHQGKLNIHIKLDTGMHRLGFLPEDMQELISLLGGHKDQLIVKSIFSHLASSEAEEDDAYTQEQFNQFEYASDMLISALGYKPLLHILNTAGIVRFPEKAYDMVRLGLGLYGIDATKEITSTLEKAHTLTASIIQIKNLEAGDSVGYNRRGKLSRPSRIAMVNIGYADGLMRSAGNGKYGLLVEGEIAPILGNVCMDITIVDVTDISDAREGSIVTIFGPELPIEKLAEVCNTIPYEVLSRLAPRVVREYVA